MEEIKKICLFFLASIYYQHLNGQKIFIPMDDGQKNHLKAYGLTYWALSQDTKAEWLLNYRGGSFLLDGYSSIEKECKLRDISFQVISENDAQKLRNAIAKPSVNAEIVELLTPPKIAVYSPKTAQPWDDAVTLVLSYAEIPYDVIFDEEVLEEKLALYDWLHLHHEDFTGQYGKFWNSFKYAQWYKKQVQEAERMALKYGYKKVSQLKLAVAKRIRDFTLGGGFLFAMCSATDSYDIALSSDGIDFLDWMYDGDGIENDPQSKIDFDNCFAFENFTLELNPVIYEYSNIDVQPNQRKVNEENDVFVLNEFSAKWDIVPTILTQNHQKIIKGFMGQTTAFQKNVIKSSVTILGENKLLNEAKYIHGTIGKGTWTFYGGHDPEDYRHMVGEEPTDLNLHPNSAGYRLILNNILFPSAKKEKKKT